MQATTRRGGLLADAVKRSGGYSGPFDYGDGLRIAHQRVGGEVRNALLERRASDGSYRPAHISEFQGLYAKAGLEQAAPDGVVYFCEDEGLADKLHFRSDAEHTLVATTAPGGAHRPDTLRPEILEPLRGRHVAILAGTIEPTQAWASRAADHLVRIAQTVRMIEPPAGCVDWHDGLSRGGGVSALLDATSEAEPLRRKVSLPQVSDRPWSQPRGDLHPLQFTDLAGELVEPAWLVPQYIAQGELAMLAGYTTSGKTTLAIALAQAVARGEPWLGMKPGQAGPVLYLDEEMGGAETRRYFQRFGGAHPNLHVACASGVRLDDARALSQLEDAVLSIRPVLIVFDSLRELLGGGDEDSSRDAAEAYRRVRWMQKRYGFTGLFVAHLTKPSRERAWGFHLLRGSSHHANAASAILAVRPRSDADSDRVLSVWKRRGCPRPEERLVGFEDHGDRWELIDLGAPKLKPDTRQEKCREHIVAHLESNGPAKWAELQGAASRAGYARTTFNEALAELKAASLIEQSGRRGSAYRLNGERTSTGLVERRT